jgi:dolichol-phosphate mannosyltransferase
MDTPAVARVPKLSVVIASYKDGQAIPHMYERLQAALAPLPITRELIFVNDGSPDDTEAVLAGIAVNDPQVVAINHTRNFGSQAAFTSGMQLATGDMVVLMDGDLQDPPEIIPQFFEQWQRGYEVVYGVRVKREATRFLQWAYKAFYRLFHALSYVDVPRDAGDFSLMDRRVVDAINTMDERDRFLRGLRAWVGFRQIGVPYLRPERMFGVTTNNLRKNFAWARKGIFSFSFVPLEIIFYLALAVSALSGVAVLVYALLYLAEGAPTGFMTLLIFVLVLGSIQLLSLAVIGDYVARVLEEVKQRPHFLVRSVFNHPAAAGRTATGIGAAAPGERDAAPPPRTEARG